MENIIEIKASNREVAIARAIKILEVTADQVVQVTELEKPKSFFGFFAKDGLYKVEVSREVEAEEIKISGPEKDEVVKTTEKSETDIEAEQEKKESKKELKENREKEIIKTSQELLNKMGLELEVEILRLEGRNCVINLYGEDNGIIIGKKGKTLNSYEYLLNTLIKDVRIDVDVEGFKEKRNVTLRDLARKMAEKAMKTTKPIKLNPMPPRERKIIHEVVNKYSELDTYSEGKDPKRYIVIRKKK
ncbi:MAG: RNA-binding cell elongation regulator Jag/EloR [Cetobacterium somerae]|jgi:spoIIIJ-associated protein|uniref:RNA-binding protein KhpB n=2 Tax=Cetobacterium TaxID=180162 RepID=U7VFJ9_9FUSO|nr:RNA-binding cell elongation regulator Jag/EloR [Cetobacterium somerae]ERT69598.1 r3H domain protein [Cetobacterium somerae ATCC BAA-474]WVJ00885.1 RNA-binding cell elongation regulator Jag/EloR [Cetobacterium somerae]